MRGVSQTWVPGSGEKVPLHTCIQRAPLAWELLDSPYIKLLESLVPPSKSWEKYVTQVTEGNTRKLGGKPWMCKMNHASLN